MKTIEEVMNDPCASFWLKDAIKSSLNRDIVDAIHDVEYLLKLLKERLNNK